MKKNRPGTSLRFDPARLRSALASLLNRTGAPWRRRDPLLRHRGRHVGPARRGGGRLRDLRCGRRWIDGTRRPNVRGRSGGIRRARIANIRGCRALTSRAAAPPDCGLGTDCTTEGVGATGCGAVLAVIRSLIWLKVDRFSTRFETPRPCCASFHPGWRTTTRFTLTARWATVRPASSSPNQPQRACPGIEGQQQDCRRRRDIDGKLVGAVGVLACHRRRLVSRQRRREWYQYRNLRRRVRPVPIARVPLLAGYTCAVTPIV